MLREDTFYRAARVREAVADGRVWLLDCFAGDEDQDSITSLNAIQVFEAVHRHYEGGWIAFLRDSDNLKPERAAPRG